MMAGHCFGTASATLQPFITSDVANFDLFAAVGSPAGVVNVVLTINAGVVVYSNTTATPALYQSAPFAAGSTVKLINHGTICGAGGNGGAGHEGPFSDPPAGLPGYSGFDAGDAIALLNDWTIDNTDGFIFGGGGGGCGGYSAYASGNGDPGAGGGGGQGRVGGNGGPGGPPGSGNSTAGVQGGAGNFSGPGAGGPSSQFGGVGGAGGAWGTKGGTTFAGTYTPPTPGKAGYAVRRNNHAVTFLGGNDTTHVKGNIK